MKFVIANTSNDDDYKGLYWSNQDGWTKEDFDVFFIEELDSVMLGFDMMWQVHGDSGNHAVRYVAAYDVQRHYGGPEEGGWWFDSGELIYFVKCFGYEQATELYDLMEEIYPSTGKRYSVLGGADYDIIIRDEVPLQKFPENRPHYE